MNNIELKESVYKITFFFLVKYYENLFIYDKL